MKLKNRLLVYLIFMTTNTIFSDDFSLPPLKLDSSNLSGQSIIFLKQVVFEGNTIFTNAELIQLVASYLNREVTAAELFDMRNLISRYYTDKGFINSGAILPDQSAVDGVVVFKIIEGKLTDIDISGNGHLRDRYIRSRIESGVTTPLNIYDLQLPLRLLHNDKLIDRIQSQLRPGMELGQSILHVDVDESQPYRLGFGFNNYRSPSIGSYRGEVAGSVRNLSGWGEEIGASYGLTEGLDDYGVCFTVPLTRRETTFLISYDNNDSTVVSNDFADLEIESQTDTLAVGLRQPLYRTLNHEFALSLQLQKKKNETSLLGLPFSFLGSGENKGVSRETVVSFGQEWIDRSIKRVITARSTLNFGIDWLDATIGETSGPDGKFVTWLGQFQWLQQLPFRESQLLFRSDLRLADDSLLPLERFSIGGHDTVRGYRENEITRDNGLILGLEYQMPIAMFKLPGVSRDPQDGRLYGSVFSDYGRGWNRNTGTADPQSLSSVGIGLKWYAGYRLNMEFYWGHALRNVTGDDEHDLQDDGFHFQINANVF